MVNLHFRVTNIGGKANRGDYVLVWPPRTRHNRDGTGVIHTQPLRVTLNNGYGSLNVEPGPLRVELRCKNIVDAGPFTITVPGDVSDVDFHTLLGGKLTYTPSEISAVQASALRAEKAAQKAAAVEGKADQINQVLLSAQSAIDTIHVEFDGIRDSAAAIRQAETTTRRYAQQAAENAAKIPEQGPPGPAGPRGEQGPAGTPGPAGKTPTITIGRVTSTTNAEATITGSDGNYTLNLGIPRGERGLPGAPGGGTGDTSGLVPQSETSAAPTPDTIARRVTGGNIRVGEATQPDHAASKRLVDTKADKTDPRFTDQRTPKPHRHQLSDIDFGDSVQIGKNARVLKHNGIAIGRNSTVNDFDGITVGDSAISGDEKAIAIGQNAQARFEESIAIGAYAVTNDPFEIVIGNSQSRAKIGGYLEVRTPTQSKHATPKAYVDQKIDSQPASITLSNVRQNGKARATRSGRVVEIKITDAASGEIATLPSNHRPQSAGTYYFPAVDTYNTTYPARVEINPQGVITATASRSGGTINTTFTYLAAGTA